MSDHPPPLRVLRSVCVYAGAAVGARPDYRLAAEELARALAARDLRLVYGGGSVGLMGVLADAALAAGVAVTGVIPRALARSEVAHAGLHDLRVVETMHERKWLMADLADAFVALPGGIGTLEELVETLSWAQLGLHAKPVGVLDAAGYWEPLGALLDRARDEGFLAPRARALLLRDTDAGDLLDRLGEAARSARR